MSSESGSFRVRIFGRAFVLLGATALFGFACSSTTSAGLAHGCTLSSDCSAPLVCSFGRCHVGCKATVDCTPGTDCVLSSSGGVCELPEESQCTSAVCVEPLVCASDDRCRSGCTDSSSCLSTQVCARGGVCADKQDVDSSGKLKTTGPDGGGRDASAGGGAGGTVATGGTPGMGGTGGMVATGGTPGMGGTGGMVATGGTAGSGGAVATGGTAGTGGSGGTVATGGAGGAGGSGGGSTSPEAGKPGCDAAWLATPPNWFGTAGASDWRPELHDPRWANAPLTEFDATPIGADSVDGSFRLLVKGQTLYVMFEAPGATTVTFNDFAYFGVARGTGGLGAFALRLAPDTTTLPVKGPAAGIPADPTLPVAMNAGYVDWYGTPDVTVANPTWTVHFTEIPPWLTDAATWRGSPGAGWAITFKVDLTQIGAAGNTLRMFFGMAVDQGSPATTFDLATPVLPAAANAVNGDTLIPVSAGNTCGVSKPCWKDVSLTQPSSGISVTTADIGVLNGSSLVSQFEGCGGSSAPCSGPLANTVRVVVHGVQSSGITAHAVRAQIRVSEGSTPGEPNAPWAWVTPFLPDAVFTSEQRALTSDPAWQWSYDAGSGDATIDYTCTAAANDYCPKLANLAASNQCLLVELGGAPVVGSAFSSFSRPSASRDVEF